MYWVKKIIAGRFMYYLSEISQQYEPKWNGLQDNAMMFVPEQALKIITKLRDKYPNDDYTLHLIK